MGESPCPRAKESGYFSPEGCWFESSQVKACSSVVEHLTIGPLSNFAGGLMEVMPRERILHLTCNQKRSLRFHLSLTSTRPSQVLCQRNGYFWHDERPFHPFASTPEG